MESPVGGFHLRKRATGSFHPAVAGRILKGGWNLLSEDSISGSVSPGVSILREQQEQMETSCLACLYSFALSVTHLQPTQTIPNPSLALK